MDQHIITGFLKVNCLLIFKKLIIGRQLYESGHSTNVVEMRTNGMRITRTL